MDEIVKRLHRYSENCVAYKLDADFADAVQQAADAIEELNSQVESLCETIDLYRECLGGHPDPRGEDGEPGIKCVDCQRDCQMIGLDMPACTAYESPKEE